MFSDDELLDVDPVAPSDEASIATPMPISSCRSPTSSCRSPIRRVARLSRQPAGAQCAPSTRRPPPCPQARNYFNATFANVPSLGIPSYWTDGFGITEDNTTHLTTIMQATVLAYICHHAPLSDSLSLSRVCQTYRSFPLVRGLQFYVNSTDAITVHQSTGAYLNVYFSKSHREP